jgi:hypothetical protein
MPRVLNFKREDCPSRLLVSGAADPPRPNLGIACLSHVLGSRNSLVLDYYSALEDTYGAGPIEQIVAPEEFNLVVSGRNWLSHKGETPCSVRERSRAVVH